MSHIDKATLVETCFSFGFNRVRFAKAQRNVALTEYDRFLANGFHGDMNWMVGSRPPRANIRELLPSLQTVVVLGVDYWHPRPPKPDGELVGRVSCYAWGRDYHKIINKQLKKLARALKVQHPELEGYWTVDSRPVIERGWAQQAGMGFVGKNTMIISPAESSYFFLATLLINVPIEADEPIVRNHCGRCNRCLDKCPTNAFVDAFRLDARKCISYLTIESKGVIEPALANKMGDWIFGCDVCQDVCPHNHKKLLSKHPDLAPRPKMAWLNLEWLCKAPKEEVLDRLAGMPLRRTGVERLRRNAVVTLHNETRQENECTAKESETLLRWLKGHAKEELVQEQLSILGY